MRLQSRRIFLAACWSTFRIARIAGPARASSERNSICELAAHANMLRAVALRPKKCTRVGPGGIYETQVKFEKRKRGSREGLLAFAQWSNELGYSCVRERIRRGERAPSKDDASASLRAAVASETIILVTAWCSAIIVCAKPGKIYWGEIVVARMPRGGGGPDFNVDVLLPKRISLAKITEAPKAVKSRRRWR